MFNGKRILAVIPARGGSKGLPGKNIRDLAGKPLIAWSIEAAFGSRYLDKVVVSTDSPEIAEAAGRFHAEVPFLRPAHLATDKAKSLEAIFHTIQWLESHRESHDIVMILQPTSPLRTTRDIDQAIELFFQKNASSIVSVCPCAHHPWWSNCLPEDGNMGNFLRPEVLGTNRQELPEFYRLNGSIYLADIHFLRENGSFYGNRTFAYVMPTQDSVDIDTLLDFKLAELLLTQKTAGEKS